MDQLQIFKTCWSFESLIGVVKICTIFYRIRMNNAKTILIAVSTVFLFTTSANACLAACKEKKRDEAYSKPLTATRLQTIIDKALPQKSVDPELGEPYQVYPIDVKPYDKDFHATLIEYPYGSSPRAVAHEPNPRGIILYAHGYNDYFFQEELAALVLNSPFLDYKNSWFVRNVAFPVFSDIALLLPDVPAPKQEAPKYNISLLKSEKGEWEFNRELKSDEWPQQYFGYLRATTRGIKWIHAGMQIKAPVLMMRSGCTVNTVKWDDDYMRCDCMLDVNLLEKWAPKLGPDVTTVTITDGMHDLFLSRKDVRDNAYRTMFEFLNGAVLRKQIVVAWNY